MKTSAVLASVLFGALAVAAPVDKRALVYKTEVVTETVVVYTTVYDDEIVDQATTTPAGYFYEQPKVSSSAVVSSSAAPQTPSPSPAPSSSAYVAPPQIPAPTPTPAPVASPSPSPSPAPVVEQSKPVEQPKSVETPQPAPTPTPSPSPAYVAPAPSPAASSSAPAAPVYQSSTGSGGSGQYNGDITIYEPNGGSGACGTSLQNTEMVAAISHVAWGASTYDVMTGAATNKWCNQQIDMFYNGNKVTVTIMDMCPGCLGDDIDLSPAAWKALTGSDEKTRYKASWSKHT